MSHDTIFLPVSADERALILAIRASKLRGVGRDLAGLIDALAAQPGSARSVVEKAVSAIERGSAGTPLQPEVLARLTERVARLEEASPGLQPSSSPPRPRPSPPPARKTGPAGPSSASLDIEAAVGGKPHLVRWGVFELRLPRNSWRQAYIAIAEEALRRGAGHLLRDGDLMDEPRMGKTGPLGSHTLSSGALLFTHLSSRAIARRLRAVHVASGELVEVAVEFQDGSEGLLGFS